MKNIDSFKQEGSLKLASIIKQYWRDRGYDVSIRVEYFVTAHGGTYAVRSDLINGMPQRRLAAP